MKKKYFDVGTFNYMREQRRGLETLAIVGIATAATSAIVGTTSALSNSSAIREANESNSALNKQALELQQEQFDETMKFNREEAQTSRDFNAEQSAIAREFNSAEAQKNRTFQAGMLEKTINQYQNWNSASSQVKRYMDAGLNPATLAGNLQSGQGFGVPSGAVASTSAASSSPASVSSPSIPNLHAMQPETNTLGNVISGALNDANSIFGALSKKEDVKGKMTENEFKHELKELEVKANKATIDKMYKDITFIDKQIDETLINIDVLKKQINKMDAEIGNIDAHTQYTNMEKFYKSQEYEQIIKNLEQKYHLERQQANALIKLYSSQMAANYGAAAQAYANAEYLKAKKELIPAEKKQLEAYEKLLNAQEFKTQKEGNRISTQDYLDTFFAYPERQRGMDISSQRLEKARYENTFFFRLLNVGRSVTQDVGDAALMYYGAKGIQAGRGF